MPREPDELRRPDSAAVRDFLIELARDRDRLYDYVVDTFNFLAEDEQARKLSPDDRAFLLESDYHRVQEVMSQSSSPARWLVIWIV